ncbi:MAG TPA: sigma-70 family RNA polymerase sigma factor [Pirellulaceae bacterium]|nr:sigma-70 family RNA polymerase sigma factor [Pirellulaceae bacterium]
MTESRSHRAASGSANNTKVDWQAALAQNDRWLRTIVYSRLRDRDAVNDVMQEVALAVVRQSSPLSDASKIAPWLYRLAVRQVLLFYRKFGRQRKLLDGYAERFESVAARETNADPLDWLLASERRQMVRVAVERLAPLDAEVLLLKYTENWSYDEIARHLGVSHGAVESRLHRARQRLREELAALEVAEVRK